MAEFEPATPKDAHEAAYAQALLADDAGREQRRARLMAALPRPEVAASMPVSDNSLAWRWQPYLLGLLVMGLLAATVLVLKGRNAEQRREIDPRLAAAQPASTPAVVVAQADAPAVEARSAPAAEEPRVVAKTSRAVPRAQRPAPVVVADATLPGESREAEASAAVAEPPRAMRAPAPAAPAIAAAPPPVAHRVPAPAPAAAPMAAAPPQPEVVAEASNQAELRARSESVASGAAARARAPAPLAQSLAASDIAESAKVITSANAVLLAAVTRVDLATARSALQAGASVHLRDAQGRTALMLAARTGSREMVELLLAAGARKADQDGQGLTAADHALAQGHGDLINGLR